MLNNPDITITTLEPKHLRHAKQIFYDITYELQFVTCSSPHEAERISEHTQQCKDYDQANTYYFDNRGTFLVMMLNDQIIGTGAIKCFDDAACELKRFYFAREQRGKGYSNILMEALTAHARTLGYKKMYLQIYRPAQQRAAVRFYKKIGFCEIPHYKKKTSALLSMAMNL